MSCGVNMALMFLSVVYDTALNLKTHETYILFEVRMFVHSRIRAVWPTCSSSHTAWDTSKHLHDLTSHVTHEANTRIDSTISGKLAYRIHVHLECEPYTALNAPLTEVVVWKMREGASRAVVEQLLTKLMSIVTKKHDTSRTSNSNRLINTLIGHGQGYRTHRSLKASSTPFITGRTGSANQLTSPGIGVLFA